MPPSVVIADGGFQANLDMIRAHICSAPEMLLARNGGTATGDGLRMAQAVGAASTGLGMFYGHLHSRDAMNTVRLWPRPYVDEIAAASVVIHADGHRFADEGLGGIYLSNVVARLPDPLGATIVFDQAIWDGPPGRGHTQPPNPLLPEAGGRDSRPGAQWHRARGRASGSKCTIRESEACCAAPRDGKISAASRPLLYDVLVSIPSCGGTSRMTRECQIF
jgi:hypothetical protein